MTTLTQLIKNIENWAEARNLIEGSTPKKQFKRDDLLSDMSYIEMHPPFKGDIARSLIDTNASMQAFLFAHERKEHEKVMNFFCYTVLGLVEVTDYYHLDIDDCVKAAWDKIKGRKGRMIDGVFVKEGDL